MAGEEITLPHGAGADNNEKAIRIDSMTGNQGKEELRQLNVELGLREEALEEGAGGLVVPREKWHLLSERFPPDGATRLMLAAKRGERDCVHFLLRCGANVDDLDMRQKNALDYAVEHPEITLLLLQWDSLITVGDHRGDREKVWMTDPLIKPFLEKRDAFHRLLREENDIKEIETFYNSHRDSMLAKDKRRRWVNTEGKSALYNAVRNSSRYQKWALLNSWHFVYATKEEREEALIYENDPELRRCVAEWFVPIQDFHVEKMVQKTYTYRGEVSGSDMTRTVEKLYREINEDEYASDILQCLQDDPSLEIVLDFSACRIGCMYPSNYRNAWGLTDFMTNRIYAGALESSCEEFERSDVLSNLTHELAHKAFALVFENRGLPYRNVGDDESQGCYEEVVREIFSRRFEVPHDAIIERALNNEELPPVTNIDDLSDSEKKLIMYELIVRVPEMIVKYKQSGEAGNGTHTGENGLCRLENEVPELLEFYEDYVVPTFKSYIERNKKAGKAVRSELLNTPHLLSVHWRENVSILWTPNEVNGPLISPHKKLQVMMGSNLSLGISHFNYSSTQKRTMFVDWRKYLCAESYFRSLLDTREVTTLVILWDDSQVVPFCRRGKLTCMSVKCPGKMLENVVKRVILMVPRRLCPEYVDCKPNDYKWIHLSMECKERLRKKSLKLGGTEMQLIEILKSVCCGNEEDAEKFLRESLDEDDISTLINRDSIDIGRPLHTMLIDRWKEMLHGHTHCFEPRVLKLRDMNLDQKFITTREQDAFVFMHTEMIALEGLNMGSIPEWKSASSRDTRYYSCCLLETPDEENILIAKILNKLVYEAVNFNNGWKYIHFFRLEGGQSVNLCSFKCNLLLEFSGEKLPLTFTGDSLLENTESNEALVIADAPGSGKSVFVNDLARRWKKTFSDSWVEVVDLSQFEELFSKLQTEIEVEEALHVLYKLVKESSNAIEEKVFKHFCGNRKKVFVFFDGFDEIFPEYRDVVTSFLKILVNTTVVQVVITTRGHECQHLEESLSTLAFSLVPFDRTQQVQFMRNEWIASLLMMPKQERREKTDTIANCLERLGNMNTEDKAAFIESLGRLHSSRGNDSSAVNSPLDALAEELMASVESNHSDEKLTEIPLHAWMLSSVAFEDNFNVLESISISDLYHKFVDIKIRVFMREKEKYPNYKPSKAAPLLVKESVYEFLKTISAFFFTGDKEYEMNWKEKMVFHRVGLISERQGKTIFVHLTFAEYFFSIWLLERIETEKGTTLLLSSVLLLQKYENVRRFIDCLLRSKNASDNITLKGNTFNLTLKVAQMNRSVFPSTSNELIMNLQMCLHACTLERNWAIVEFIRRNSENYAQKIMLGEIKWSRLSQYDRMVHSTCFAARTSTKKDNAFYILRDCVSDLNCLPPRYKTSYLIILINMLALSRSDNLIWRINSILERAKLWWVGLKEYDLLRCGQGRKEFKKIFDFLIENKDILNKNLVDMLVKYDLNELREVAVIAFELFVYFIELISPYEEFGINFSLGDDFHENFFLKAQGSRLAEVKEIWYFLVGKLTTGQKIDVLAMERWSIFLAASLYEGAACIL